MHKIANFFGLQIGWFAGALGAANGYPAIGPLAIAIHLVLHLVWAARRDREALFLLIAGVLGIIVDSAFKLTGLINYASNFPEIEWLAPLWIVAMWLLFASTFSSSLVWLQNKYALAALLGAVGGPMSYLAGQRLGAVALHDNVVLAVGMLALVWGLVVPLLTWLSKIIVISEI